MTEEGYITVIGRKSAMIKVGTIKIFPAEVEKVLSEHPIIDDVAVVGVPDARLGQVICACIVAKPNIDMAELKEWCKDKFTVGYHGMSSAPNHFITMNELPIGDTGKVNRLYLQNFATQELNL